MPEEVEESDAKRKLRVVLSLARESQRLMFRKIELMLDCDSALAAVDAEEDKVVNERLAEINTRLAMEIKGA